MIGGRRSDRKIENSGDFLHPGEPDLAAAFHTLNPAHFNSALQGNYAFDPSSFLDQQLGSIGDSPRTICCGPPIRNFDLSVFKETSIGERVRSEFRAEFFNGFNHSQFYNRTATFQTARTSKGWCAPEIRA